MEEEASDENLKHQDKQRVRQIHLAWIPPEKEVLNGNYHMSVF
jgi:hypothetical protein